MKLLRLLPVALVAMVIFFGGLLVGGHPQETGLTELPDEIQSVLLGNSGQDLSAQVLDVLRERYFTEFDEAELEQTSVDALLDSLDDPFTVYLDPDELERLRDRTNGRFQGVGLQVTQQDGRVVVTGVFKGSPAEEAGLMHGDIIVAVDGEPTADRDLDEIVQQIRGPEGVEVVLRLVRPGKVRRIEVPLERAKIELDVVTSRVEELGGRRVGYVALSQFTRGATGDVREAVERLGADGVIGYVLDLRGDPGGLVSEAVGVGSVFLPKGSLIATTEGRKVPRDELRASGDPLTTSAPLVVLVDGDSASSAEIVSGALRDHGRATLVGSETFGKALVQSTVPLRDGGALKLTTAQYETPDGLNVNKNGLVPSVRAADDPATPRDEALDAALGVIAAAR